MTTLDERFPPSIPANENTVATFIPSRSPEFKVHKTPGLAHSALGQRGFYDARAKYELRDGEWQRVWAYVPPDNCRRCNRRYADVLAEQARQAQAVNRFYRPAKYHADPTHTGPGWNAEPVCKICVEQIKQDTDKAEQEESARALHDRYFLNK